MAIREQESEFAQFPKEQVVDWLGHPVTEYLRKAIGTAMHESDCAIVNQVEVGNFDAAKAVSNLKVGYRQVLETFEKADDYVKA